jgi:HEAT repeat protein
MGKRSQLKDRVNSTGRFARTILLLFSSGLFVICAIGSAETQPPSSGPSRQDLAKLLESTDAHMRAYAVYAVAYRFSEDAGDLASFLSDADPWVRRAATFCLGLLRSEPETDRFVQALQDEHYGVRRAAVFALGNVATPKALEAISHALKDDDSVVRQLGILAVARAGDSTCVPRLIAMLNDESPRVRRAAACALGILGDRSALPELRRLYQNRRASDPAEAVATTNNKVEEALKRRVNLDCKFIHFAEILDKLSETSGVEIRVDDEVLFKLNTSATDPENLNSIRLSMWGIPFETALKKIADTLGAHYYVESGTINIASKNYIVYDTPVRMEVAAAMALLGDQSGLREVRKYLTHRVYGRRAHELLRAAEAR